MRQVHHFGAPGQAGEGLAIMEVVDLLAEELAAERIEPARERTTRMHAASGTWDELAARRQALPSRWTIEAQADAAELTEAVAELAGAETLRVREARQLPWIEPHHLAMAAGA